MGAAMTAREEIREIIARALGRWLHDDNAWFDPNTHHVCVKTGIVSTCPRCLTDDVLEGADAILAALSAAGKVGVREPTRGMIS